MQEQDKNRKVQKYIQECERRSAVPAVVLGSSVNGLSYLRSLGPRKAPLLCLDHTRGPAAASHYGRFVLAAATPGEQVLGEAAADEVFATLNSAGIRPIVFGTADDWQTYVARRNTLPKPPFLSLAPSERTMSAIVDKQAQYQVAAEAGIPVPSFANAAEVHSGRADWREFPAIVKPRWAHIGREAIGGKAIFVKSEDDLQKRLDDLLRKAHVEDYIVQSVLQGSDTFLYSYLGFFEPAGHEFAGMVKRKLRQFPPFLGDGSYDVTCTDEPLADAARKLLAALEYRGLVGVEFKRHPDSDAFSLVEINPRTVSTNQLAIEAGIDFPWIAYQMAVHLHYPDRMPRPGIPNGYRVDYHHVNEERDFKTYLIRRKSGDLRFSEWIRSVMTAESYALWNKRDPGPFAALIWSAAVRWLSRIAAKWRRPKSTKP